MKRVSKYFGFVLPSIIALSISPCYAEHAILDVEKMMQESGLDIDRKKLMAHEILVIARADQEVVDSAIVLDMFLYVKAPYKEVIKELRNGDNQLSDYPGAAAIQIDNINMPESSLKKLSFTQGEGHEVEKLFAYKNGDAYNLSSAEIKQLRTVAATTKKDRSAAATSFYREILNQRLKEYKNRGIHSITSYQHSGDQVDVSNGFIKATESLTGIQKWFPLFYKDFLNYPKSSSEGYRHKFYGLKDGIDDRPVFILKHQMVKEKKNGTLIAERQFYISHGLDALQIEIMCLPYKEGTFIGLAAHTFTGKVAGYGSFVAHKVGRYQMEKQIRPMFESLQRKFSH